MQFVHPTLAWGFLLALIPILIHLINLVRRRRVQWAAMEFLLQSYRRHRTWIWLQQFLLLLLRTIAVALLVAMLAQWVTQREWFALLGGTATHHFVIVDDSFSMAERSAGATAFDRAEQAFGNIVGQAMRQDTPQKLTVLRTSRAVIGSRPVAIADASGEIVDASFESRLAEIRRQLELTESAVGPLGALQVAEQLMADAEDENKVVYLVSDFRERDWRSPAEVRGVLEKIAEAGAEIQLIDCAGESQSNLSIVDIQPSEDTRAAGVPLFVEVQVKNNGSQPERRVPVQVRTWAYDPLVVAASKPGEQVARQDEPPAVLIDEIQPGQTVSVRSQVYFSSPGPQVVEANLPDDALTTDSRRWTVINLAEGEPVLIVDGSDDGQHAYYVASAFAPGQRTVTGILPDTQPVSFLRDAELETLQRYRAIYLVDVPRLDERAKSNLVSYVSSGGGLGIFVGENVNVRYYNEALYEGGQGLFPVPLDRVTALEAELFENVPDLEVADHPVFNVFLGDRNPLIQWVRFEQYIRPAPDWEEDPLTPVQVLARLRNGDPLSVGRTLGEGRVVAFLSTAAPVWNNWANDPSFVVVMLKLHAFLAAPGRRVEPLLVDAPFKLELDAEMYRPEVSFVTPDDTNETRLVSEKVAVTEGGSLVAALDRGETAHAGVYEAWTNELGGGANVQRFAVNVDAVEGQLERPSTSSLLERLEPVDVQHQTADDYALGFLDAAGANRSLLLMVLLVAALLGEQLLAYFTSFHPSRGSTS